VNLLTAFIAASVVGVFQSTIEKVVALAVFMPIVPGMGGNAATQTLAVVVRGLALGELTWANGRQALLKEGLVGLGNGIVNGVAGAIVVGLFTGNWMLGWILALAMVANLLVAAMAGTLIPLGLRAARIDPALASTVFITTLTDVCGIFAFLGLATVFLRFLQ
jgi:magnesium transporter